MLDEVVVPVYIIADPAPAAVTKLCAGTTIVGPTSTALIAVQLFNPPRSGVIINVTDAVVQSNFKQTTLVSFFDIPLADPSSNVHFRDRRNAGEPSGQMFSAADTVGVLGDFVAVLETDGALTQTAAWNTSATDPRQPLTVLDEGKGVVFQGQLVVPGTDELRVNMRWLEIPITEQRPAGGIP